MCQITPKLSTSFHPPTDGQTERANQTLEQYLRMFCSYNQDNWVSHLPFAEFVCNNSVSNSTKKTPFEANYGYHPCSTVTPNPAIGSGLATTILARIRDVQTQLRLDLKQLQEDYKRFSDKHRRPAKPFKVGQFVWLS